MGSDDLFKKRKARLSKDLARQKAKRASYDRILIVCEGAKTEPNYFRELVDYLELNTANIEVDGSCGSSPLSVFNHSKSLYQEERKQGDAFDRVFCVFDKDTHETYEQALNSIANTKPKGVFQAIYSVPCFEYWLLLHFEFSTKPFASTGKKSCCARLLEELEKYMPNYSKGAIGVYHQLKMQTGQAIAWSNGVLEQAQQLNTDNPSTLMHELVAYLQELKK